MTPRATSPTSTGPYRRLPFATARAIDDCARAFVVANDVVERFPQLLDVQRIAIEHTPRRLRVAENGCQGLTQLVRERS